MTPEEHHARAMLMGRIYIPWASIYVIPEEWASPTIKVSNSWMDADTLEEVAHENKMDRLVSKADVPSDLIHDIFKLEVPEWQRN